MYKLFVGMNIEILFLKLVQGLSGKTNVKWYMNFLLFTTHQWYKYLL